MFLLLYFAYGRGRTAAAPVEEELGLPGKSEA
jgi:hypothetical protein